MQDFSNGQNTNQNLFRRHGIAGFWLPLVVGALVGVLLYRNMGYEVKAYAQDRDVVPRGELFPEEQRTIKLFETASPSVVFITTKAKRRAFFDVVTVDRGTGSGFVWDKHGHIVTNYHVLLGGNAFQVTLANGNAYDAEVVGVGRDKDLAVLRIGAPSTDLQPLPLGTSHDLKVGQNVYAIGNPFGWDQTLTTGVVSALNRTIPSFEDRHIHGVIQTDAAINPGNSGGPLLDSAGRLIGVNTQIYSTSGSSAGIGFAVPSDIVAWAVPQMIKYGKIKRPGLGIQTLMNNEYWARRFRINSGIIVYMVEPRGAAARAGLRNLEREGNRYSFDVITAIDGEKVRNIQDLDTMIDKYKVGDVVKVTILREGKPKVVNIELQAMN